MPDWLFFLDDVKAVCGPYCLQWWQTVGIWMAGIATLSAVIVSLSLARRQQPRVRISAGIRRLIQPGSGATSLSDLPSLLSISIRNVGERPVKIEAVGWRTPRWRKLNALQTIPPQMSGVTLPHVLDAGDALNLYISLDDPEIDWMPSFARDFLGRWPWIEVRFLRVQTWTPAGHLFEGSLEHGLRQRLLEEKRKQPRQPDVAQEPASADSEV